ncbi:MAG: MOSC N-terminal beta barrel domain-containing protein [Myxococcales bacterium]|nr:MOSC N-terminal beta barrel domain-containing protein [Myxococcales bacterium]
MRVAGLFHYPVKSLRGVAVEALELGARGPLHDREWMLVDAQGRFLSQRGTPRMATLTASLTSDTLRLGDDSGATLEVPRENDGTSLDVTVWRDTVAAIDCGDAAAAWLEARLHHPCRLVRLPDSTIRPLDPKFSPRPDAQTGFADGYPVLLTNASSVDALNRELPHPLGMERFRPNVVITGAPEWAEDEWRVVQAGGVTLDLVKPCARCAVITTDQRSGEKPDGATPLTVLAANRTLPPFGAIFGQNAVHRATGTLRLGDPLTVLEKQPRPAFVPR